MHTITLTTEELEAVQDALEFAAREREQDLEEGYIDEENEAVEKARVAGWDAISAKLFALHNNSAQVVMLEKEG